MFCTFTRPRYQVSVYRTIGPLDVKFYHIFIVKRCVQLRVLYALQLTVF